VDICKKYKLSAYTTIGCPNIKLLEAEKKHELFFLINLLNICNTSPKFFGVCVCVVAFYFLPSNMRFTHQIALRIWDLSKIKGKS
jgi:hypothetical protein